MTVMKPLLALYDHQVSVHRGYARHGLRRPFSKVTGVHTSSISNWRRTLNCRLDTFEAVANSLGFEVVLQNRKTGEIVKDG